MSKIVGCFLALVTSVTFSSTQLAYAQSEAPPYEYVEEPPLLQVSRGTPARGGQEGMQALILQNVRYPADALRAHIQGTLTIAFTVTAAKQITQVRIREGLTASLDSAVVAVVRQLIVFAPGRHNDLEVAVRCTVALPLAPDPLNLPAALSEPEPKNEYTYVGIMPALPTGGREAAIIKALQQRLVLPPDAIAGVAYVEFTVLATGKIAYAYMRKGLNPATDAALLDAVHKLPPLTPGQIQHQAVAVSLTLAVPIVLPKRWKPSN